MVLRHQLPIGPLWFCFGISCIQLKFYLSFFKALKFINLNLYKQHCREVFIINFKVNLLIISYFVYKIA